MTKDDGALPAARWWISMCLGIAGLIWAVSASIRPGLMRLWFLPLIMSAWLFLESYVQHRDAARMAKQKRAIEISEASVSVDGQRGAHAPAGHPDQDSDR